ncbi:MAG: ATP-binding protein, partial [Psychrosphaera sp.]|nr:ATP-binding protein [Psychrosphaera sp.]
SIFIANVSHEIRTPLNAVLGYTQMLDRDTTLGPEHKKKVGIIEKSGLHLLSLINDILDISKIEADAMQLNNIDFELVELVDDIALMFAGRCHEKQLDWQCVNRCESSIEVHGDQGKLRQTLINLLGNAVKFTAQGSVTLALECLRPNHYRLTISDTGIGIAPQHQQQIFKAFGQSIKGSKYGGTGLGLAIASKQIALMGGQLKLDSQQGKGSRFYFTLVLPPAEAPIELDSKSPIGSLKLAPGVSASAMVVDDVKENRDILSQILIDAGLSVFCSVNGQDALDYLHGRSRHQKDQHHSSALPDLIFMDIRMPIMDGIKAMQAIQHDFKGRCPICIVITAQAMQQDVDRYLNEGFDHYIAKPFRFEEVYACIHQLLDVEFDTQQPVQALPAPTKKTAPDFTDLRIPAALYQKILEGANDYEMTKLEQCLSELAELTPQAQQFAEVLHQYISGYDMEGLLGELAKVGSDDE